MKNVKKNTLKGNKRRTIADPETLYVKNVKIVVDQQPDFSMRIAFFIRETMHKGKNRGL